MLISIDRQFALPVLKRVSSVAPSSSAVPVLTGMLLNADADKKTLTITASNLDLSIRCVIPANVKEGGRIVVNASVFEKMVSLFSERKILLRDVGGDSLLIRCGNSQYLLACMRAADYPTLDFSSGNTCFTLGNFTPLLKTISFAVNPSAKMIAQQSIKFEAKKNQLSMTATDGFCLAQTYFPVPEQVEFRFLITYKSALLMTRLFEGAESLSFTFSNSAVMIGTPDTSFRIRTVSSAFLDSERIFSSFVDQYGYTIPALSYYLAMDSLGGVVDSQSSLHLSIANEKIVLACHGPNGTCSTSIPLLSAKGVPSDRYHYSAKMLLLISKAADGDVVFSFDKTGLMQIKTANQDYLLTPCRPFSGSVPKEKKIGRKRSSSVKSQKAETEAA